MTQQNKLWDIIVSPALWKRALQGAGLGLLLLIIFMSAVGVITDGPWVCMPMVTVLIGGAGGGAFFHLMHNIWHLDNLWKKVLVNTICFVVYIVSLWLSLVFALSLVGLWD